MSASGKAMWTSILFFLACFLPNALSEETKEHPSIGKEVFLNVSCFFKTVKIVCYYIIKRNIKKKTKMFRNSCY